MPFIGLDSAIRKTSKMANQRKSNIQQMREHISLFLLREAKKRAPHETGALERGIQSDVRGTEIFLTAGGEGSARYAGVRHDNDYQLRAGSLRKQSSDNVKVGKNYLKRAIQSNKKKILKGLELVNAGKLSEGEARVT